MKRPWAPFLLSWSSYGYKRLWEALHLRDQPGEWFRFQLLVTHFFPLVILSGWNQHVETVVAARLLLDHSKNCGSCPRKMLVKNSIFSKGKLGNELQQEFFFHFLSLGRCWMVTESLSFTSQAELGQDAWVFSLHLQAFPRIASCAWRMTVESNLWRRSYILSTLILVFWTSRSLHLNNSSIWDH